MKLPEPHLGQFHLGEILSSHLFSGNLCVDERSIIGLLKHMRIPSPLKVLLLMAVFDSTTLSVFGQACCTLSGYQYARSVTIDNTGGPAYTNVQVLFVFNTQTPISQGKMQASGNDIRFKDANCGNNLNYWIESGINTANTEIWILVPSIPANAVKTITMFYGNPAAASQSAFGSVFTNVYTVAGTITLTGTQNYDWFEVPAGATVNTQSGQILTINARKVKVAGTISGNSLGYGPAGGPGAGGSGGGSIGGGGGGYGAQGGRGGGNNNGGAAYGTANGTDIDMGSGGGGSDCGPTGPGGGAVRIQSEAAEITGTISMRGGAASSCCCGNSSEAAAGGAGGGIYVDGRYIKGNGTLDVTGGTGGNSSSKEGGGGGAGGRIKLFACTQNNFTGTTTANGGPNGSGGQNGMQPGGNGTITTPACTRYAISVGVETELPVADFTTADVCNGSAVNFTDASTLGTGSIVGWDWDFGDGSTSTQQNTSHTYGSANTYSVTLDILTDAGCTATFTDQVTVNPIPTAEFTFADACEGDAVTFTDASSIASGSIQSWSWNFGDGSPTDNSQSPTHTYTTSGTFTVTLNLSSNNGCTATVSHDVVISAVPVADFSATAVCFGYSTDFTDNSSISAGSIAQWAWDFGNGSTSTQQNPAHQFAAEGNYNVSLSVTSSDGCTDNLTTQVVVHPAAAADFSATSVCQGNPTVFTNLSSVASGLITNYDWDFGNNGSTSMQQSPMNMYTSAGTFTVTLMITTDFGCEATVSQTVDVYENPVADFSVADVCLGAVSSFADNSTISSGSIASWNWDFGDGSVSSLQNPTHSYGAAGTYSVQLTITSDNGCQTSVTNDAIVNENPVADFAFTDVCESQATTLTDQSSIGNGTISSWSWDLGDGSSLQSTQNVSYVYGTFGTYNVTLTVTTTDGCADDTTQTVEVFPGVAPDFSSTTECEGYETQFTDLSAPSGGATITNWDWDFGDASTSTLQNPTHSFGSYGNYSVTLVVTTDNGCTGTVSNGAVVNAMPSADFSVAAVCLHQQSVFNDLSTIAFGSISSYAWNMGDGGNYTQQNPQHAYAADGSYNVELIITSDAGCNDTVSHTATVHPLPNVNFSFTPDEGCEALTIELTDLSSISSGSNQAWTWLVGLSSISQDQNATMLLEFAGSYNVALMVTSDQGCSDTLVVQDAITVHPLPEAEFSWDPIVVEIIEPKINFIDESTGATQWTWYFGFGTSSDEPSPTIVFPDTGIFPITLITENQFGCTDTVNHNVYIRPAFLIYIPNAFTPDHDRINDIFRVEGMGMRNFEMWIYDRWGKELFYSNDPLIGWDGRRKNGEPLRPGVYVYRVQVQGLITDHVHTYEGKIQLVR